MVRVPGVTVGGLHPVIERAAGGHLPAWAEAGESRREHMARVADVLDDWARTLEVGSVDRVRWRALGFLHDALRDADVDELRRILEEGGDGGSSWTVDWSSFAQSPRSALVDDAEDVSTIVGGILHGPAAAMTLVRQGVDDMEVLAAVAYHTVGHPELAPCGRALYCADFVEPGRSTDPEMRAELRERYPDDPDGVLQDVLRSRVAYLLERGRPIFFGTVGMWNRLTR